MKISISKQQWEKLAEKNTTPMGTREMLKDPNCPPEILTKVLEEGLNDEVSQIAAANKNCPAETLAKILQRGDTHKVSAIAAENKNCPESEVEQWIMKIIHNFYQIRKFESIKYIFDHWTRITKILQNTFYGSVIYEEIMNMDKQKS